MRIALTVTLILCLCVLASAQPSTLKSPDGRLTITFSALQGKLTYEVSFRGKTLIEPSAMALDLQGARPLGADVRMTAVEAPAATAEENYTLVAGKTSRVRARYKQLHFDAAAPDGRHFLVEARAYDDAIAFRYVVPAQPAIREYRLVKAQTEFRIAKDATTWSLELPNYRSMYESEFVKLPPQPTPEKLPGAGLAQHPFLYCGEWQDRGHSDQVMQIVRGGKVEWSYAIPGREEYGDCTRLSNGNIVFSRRFSASEITPEKKIVWNYDAPPNTEIHTAYPMGKDRVLVMQNGDPAKLLVIEKATNKVVKEMILPTRSPEGIHGQFRHVRVTKAGTFLVAHLDLGKVVEYSPEGSVIWSVPAPSAWGAVRLKNGNTLISGNQHGYVREVNPAGETVWEINRHDLPGYPLYTVQEVDRLANGNTVICNWAGSLPFEQWTGAVQIIEVTPDKKVVWALRDWKTLGPASSIQLLDEKGVPENGDLQR